MGGIQQEDLTKKSKPQVNSEIQTLNQAVSKDEEIILPKSGKVEVSPNAVNLEKVTNGIFAGVPAQVREVGERLLLGLQSDKGMTFAEENSLLSTLSPLERSAIRTTLQNQGLYLHPDRSGIPVMEDSTAKVGVLNMQSARLDPYMVHYVIDALRASEKENFVINLTTNYEPDGVKRSIQKRLGERLELSSEDAAKLIDSRLKVISIKEKVSDYVEDRQQALSGSRTIQVPPPVSGDTLKAYQRFVRTKNIHKDATSQTFGLEGMHDIKVLSDPDRAGINGKQSRELEKEASLENKSLPIIARGSSDSQSHEASFMGRVASDGPVSDAREIARLQGIEVKETRAYFEGGNALLGQRQDGRPYAIIGRDSLLISAIHLDSLGEKGFANEDVLKRVALLEGSPDFQNLNLINETSIKLENAGLMPADLTSEERVSASKIFLAKLDLTKEVIASDMNLSVNEVMVVPQPQFHLDMEIRPITPGKVLLHDYQEDRKLLSRALEMADPESEEHFIMTKTLEEAAENEALNQQLVNAIAKTLEDQEIEVVRVGGIIKNNLTQVNFLNAVAGTKAGTNEQFYMTNHSGLPSLNKAFEEILKKEGIERVHFLAGVFNPDMFGTAYTSSGVILGKSSAGFACIADHFESP